MSSNTATAWVENGESTSDTMSWVGDDVDFDEGLEDPPTYAAPDPGNRDTGYFAGYGPGHNVFVPEPSGLVDLLRVELVAASNGDREGSGMAVSGLLSLTDVRARYLAGGYDYDREVNPAMPAREF